MEEVSVGVVCVFLHTCDPGNAWQNQSHVEDDGHVICECLCRHLLSVATSGDGKCSIYIFDDPYKLLISINIKLNAIAW